MEQSLIQKKIDSEVDRLLSKYSFWEFCLYYDLDFFTRRPFLKEVAEAFQWVYDEYIEGRPRTASVSMPPRAGKSYITSLFSAWWMGKLPEEAVMRNACTAKLYRKFSYDIRKIVRSSKWRAVFPGLNLSRDMASVEGWNLDTAKQVTYFGAGVRGTIIGFGANIAISDDLYKGMEDALSENKNELVHLWKESDHNSRKELNCPEIYIGTRWTKRDVIGKAIEDGDVDRIVKIAALTPDNKSFCENVKTTAEYLKMRNRMDETIWEAEFMQEPIENKGLLFPKADLKFYDPTQIDIRKAEYIMVQIDPADTGGDFYAAALCRLIDNRVYVTDVLFNTNGTDTNSPDTVHMVLSNKAHQVNVEGNSAWILFGKEIRNKVNEKLEDCGVRIFSNSTSKETRILANSTWIKNHMRFRQDYKDDKQYYAFIRNLTGYLREGGNKHDDAPDVLADAARHFQTEFSHLF